MKSTTKWYVTNLDIDAGLVSIQCKYKTDFDSQKLKLGGMQESTTKGGDDAEQCIPWSYYRQVCHFGLYGLFAPNIDLTVYRVNTNTIYPLSLQTLFGHSEHLPMVCIDRMAMLFTFVVQHHYSNFWLHQLIFSDTQCAPHERYTDTLMQINTICRTNQ